VEVKISCVVVRKNQSRKNTKEFFWFEKRKLEIILREIRGFALIFSLEIL
jgi:hypothetical protein